MAQKINFEKMAVEDAAIEAHVLKAKEDRISQIRNQEYRIVNNQVPFAQRSRFMN